MDSDGFVRLSEISKWNRIRRIGASPYTVTFIPHAITEAMAANRWILTLLRTILNHNIPLTEFRYSLLSPQILEAVQSCNTLETRVLWDVESARGNEEETAALSSISILATLIRCVDNPLAWVLQQHPVNNSSASNDTDTGSTFSTF